jgi:hypothetical protein
MDVTFRKFEPFYGEKVDLSVLFKDLNYNVVSPKGESSSGTGIREPLQLEQQVKLQPLVGVILVQQDNNKA